MTAALMGLDATGWAVAAGLVTLGVVVALGVATAVGLAIGRVIRNRDQQTPHGYLHAEAIALYGLDDDCTDDRIVLAAMEHLEHDRTD